MRLDKAAFTALHILPQNKDNNRTPTSLLGFLNKCRTPIGTRKLQSWYVICDFFGTNLEVSGGGF